MIYRFRQSWFSTGCYSTLAPIGNNVMLKNRKKKQKQSKPNPPSPWRSFQQWFGRKSMTTRLGSSSKAPWYQRNETQNNRLNHIPTLCYPWITRSRKKPKCISTTKVHGSVKLAQTLPQQVSNTFRWGTGTQRTDHVRLTFAKSALSTFSCLFNCFLISMRIGNRSRSTLAAT